MGLLGAGEQLARNAVANADGANANASHLLLWQRLPTNQNTHHTHKERANGRERERRKQTETETSCCCCENVFCTCVAWQMLCECYVPGDKVVKDRQGGRKRERERDQHREMLLIIPFFAGHAAITCIYFPLSLAHSLVAVHSASSFEFVLMYKYSCIYTYLLEISSQLAQPKT